jgi:hypothetical protein
MLHRLGPMFLDVFELRAVSAAAVTLRAVILLYTAYKSGSRKWPKSMPVSFLRPAWQKAMGDSGGDGSTGHRRAWETATFAALEQPMGFDGCHVLTTH